MHKDFLIFVDFVRKLYRTRHMIIAIALRDLRARYIGSSFGLLWAVLFPLLQVGIYGTVFGVFFGSKPDPASRTDSFLLYLLCGLLPWFFFSQTIIGSSTLLISNRNLLKKAVGFPSEDLPIIHLTVHLINHTIGLAILFFVLIAKQHPLDAHALLMPVFLLCAILFTLGVSWTLSSLNPFVRDIQQVMNVGMLAWFFFTPIFYPPSRIPEQARLVLLLNPMYHVVEGYRATLLAGNLPPITHIVYLMIASFASFACGGLLFRRLKPGFAEVV